MVTVDRFARYLVVDQYDRMGSLREITAQVIEIDDGLAGRPAGGRAGP